MANYIKKYSNNLSIRFIKKAKKYFITYGVMHIKVNGEYLSGFKTFEDAEQFLLKLKYNNSTLDWLK